MSWFDEQIHHRDQSDQEIMEDSLLHIASSVLGRGKARKLQDKQTAAQDALEEILKYYGIKPAGIHEEITDLEDQLEMYLQPHGLMWRRVELGGKWYRDSMGPILGFRKDNDNTVALLPGPLFGYYYRDPETGIKHRVSKKNASLFSNEGLCFYSPLPLRKLGVRDLLIYLVERLDAEDFIIFFALALSVTLLGMLYTNITRALTGFVLESKDIPLLMGTAVFMVSTVFASVLIDTCKQMMMSRITLKASIPMDAAMMMRIMQMPPRFFHQYASGELSTRYNAIRQFCDLLLGNIFSTGISAILSMLYITQIFLYARSLVGASLLIIAAGVVFSLLSGLIQMRVSRELMERSAKESGLSFALISGIQKIRLSGAEKRAFAKWGHSYADVAALSYNPPLLTRIGSAVSIAINLIGTIALFFLAVKNKVTPSEYIAFNSAYGAVSASFGAITGAALSIAAIRPVLDVAKPILETEPEASENRALVSKLSGNIELSGVYFRYDPNMPWVIKGLDLKIRSGDYVAIVGTTGCGKSTLVRLLLGFEKPDKGAVYYDGKDITNLDLHSLRRRIGTVTQDGTLFQGDIFSNITVSAPQMKLEDAWRAAELAGIADDIREMPMGMQTQISEGQGGISGGQKQRLMIARAVVGKPKILILDEATSALDNRTQQQVADALDQLKCTRIVIAHRLSTIKNCNRILVLNQGRIQEEGTYDELVAKNGFFAELIKRQRLDA